MRIIDSLWRVTKLGFFLSWGVAATVLGACASTGTPKPDVAPVDGRSDVTSAKSDAARPDGRRDAHSPDQKPAPDKRGWDVPLE